MKKFAVILGTSVMMLAFSIPAMAYNSISPTTDPPTVKKINGHKDPDRESPDTGEAPILLGFGAAAAASAAGIAVCLKKKKPQEAKR